LAVDAIAAFLVENGKSQHSVAEGRKHNSHESIDLSSLFFLGFNQPLAFTPRRIRSIQRRLNVSQPVPADLLYVTKATASKWEQGVRKPSGSALRLLEIADKQPHVLVQD
jgi:putative transcriptional regulator